MGCSHRNSATAIAASQCLPGHGTLEPSAAKARDDRTKIKLHVMRDSVHVDPEHVWGDEGPVNE